MKFLSSLIVLSLCPGLWPGALGADRILQARWTEETIVLDGILSEPPWFLAQPAADFIQAEPRQGEPSTQRTEVRVLFDSDNLYFGVICFDSDPDGIVANSLRRDFAPGNEDTFEILLDTFASSRDGFLFVTNPNGAKRDVQVSNEGRGSNVSWDAIWEVKTHIDESGWSAEILIPIKTLRYGSSPEGTWKVNFGRQIRRNNEITYWSEIPRRYNITRVSLAGELAGVNQNEIHPGRNFFVTPYLATNLSERDSETSSDLDVGLDLKYGLTSSLTLDGTYNTDFSHVEVDQQQVNLERFRLSFPEKRDFFLENEGIFAIGSILRRGGTPNEEDPSIFYSRTIGLSEARQPIPILGGARLTGRAGPYELGLMSLQTEEAEGQGEENSSVLRMKRDILARSWLGGFFLNRQGSDRVTNRVYGTDGLYRPRTDLTFNYLFAQTDTPGVAGDDWALRVEGEYSPRWLVLSLIHADIQPEYRNDLGFNTREGIKVERITIHPRIRPWEGRAIREIQPILNTRYITDPDNRLITRKHSIGLDFFFQNGTFLRFRRRVFFERLDQGFDIRTGILVPSGDHEYEEQGVEFNTDRSRVLSVNVNFYDGEFWDGEKTSVRVGGRFRPSGHLSAEVNFSRDDVTLPGGAFLSHLLGFRLRYAFNTQTFLDTFIQYNSERHKITSNVRFNLIHHSLSDLFVVYTEENPTIAQESTDRVISIKYTHLLGF